MLSRTVWVAVLVFCGAAAFAQTDPAGEAAIRRIVAEQAKAWNAGDGAACARDVAADVSFTNVFGRVM